MKYTKTAVAVAIAGFVAVPMTASAETTLSGLVQIKYLGSDADAGGESDDDGDLSMAAGDVRVAINSQNEIVGGLTGYGNIQFNLDDLTGEGGDLSVSLPDEDPTDTDDPQEDEDGLPVDGTAGTVAADNIYVGVMGGFGDVRLGEIPLAVEYGQVANDIYDVGATVVDGISYVGAFGPVGVVANYSLEDDSDMVGLGGKVTFAGVTFGLGYELRDLAADDTAGDQANYALGASFALAGFSIGAHYWLQEGANNETDFEGDLQSASVQVGYGIAGVNLGLTYSLLTTDITDDEEAEESSLRLDAGYDLGGGLDISTRITATEGDPFEGDDGSDIDPDLVEYRVQLTKNF